MGISKREPRPRQTVDEILFVPLVGKFDFDNPIDIVMPSADEEYTKRLDELDSFYRQSERLRDFV